MALTWTIADYVNDAARECSLTPPSGWPAATGATEKQFIVFLKDTVRELLQRHDWNALTADQTVTGTGASSYALDSAFLRLANEGNGVFETTGQKRSVLPVPGNGDWTELETWNWSGSQRYYRLQGSNIEFFKALETGDEVTVAYVSKNWKAASDLSAPGTTWTADGDVSYLPGVLLQLGLIWRFRRNKGLPYADRKAEFESELARYIGDDRPSRRISFDAYRDPQQHPMRVPVPDFIPSS